MVKLAFFTRYIGLVAISLLLAWLMSTQQVWSIVLSVPILALPGFFAIATWSALRKGHTLTMFASKGRVRSWFGGAGIRLVWSAGIALFVTGFALPGLLTMESWPFLVAPFVFLVVHERIRSTIGHELSPAYRKIIPIFWSYGLTATVLFLLSVLWNFFVPLSTPSPDESAAAGSALAREIMQWAALWQEIGTALRDSLAQTGWAGRLIGALLVSGGSSAFAASLAALAAIPPKELTRAFAPASVEVNPPSPRVSTLAWTSGIATLLFFFVWLPAVGSIDFRLSITPPDERPVAVAETVAERFLAEKIGEDFFEPGTIAIVRDVAKDDLAKLESKAREDLRSAIERASEKMESNVDLFLDGYYSLIAEYARIAAMLTGTLEAELQDQLRTALETGNPMEPVQTILSEIKAGGPYGRLSPGTMERYKAILDARRVFPGKDQTVEIIASCSEVPCIDLEQLSTEMWKDVQKRMMTSGLAGAGVASAIVAGLVVKKVVAKGTLKLAAKALAKVATKKAASAGIGAVVGGVIGSVVPGAGTTAGAILGTAAVSLIVGVGLDALMLEVEKNLQREDFRAEIVHAIRTWRNSALATLETPAIDR